MNKYVRETSAAKSIKAIVIMKGKRHVATVQAHYGNSRCLVNVWHNDGSAPMQHGSASGGGMNDPVMTLYNHVKRNPMHLSKSLTTIAKHRASGRFDPDLALRLLRNNVTDNVRAMPDDRFTIAHVSAVAHMLLVESAKAVQS